MTSIVEIDYEIDEIVLCKGLSERRARRIARRITVPEGKNEDVFVFPLPKLTIEGFGSWSVIISILRLYPNEVLDSIYLDK